MRVNSDDPDSQVYSGRLTTAPQRPGPALQYLARRDIHLIESQSLLSHRVQTLNSINSTNSINNEEACISEGFYLKGKTLKAETLKTNFTGEVGQ